MDAASATQQSFKIGIVDDHPIIRQGLLQTISREPDMQVCTEASGIAEALEKMEGAKKGELADVLVVDISLDGENGIDLIDYVKSRARLSRFLSTPPMTRKRLPGGSCGRGPWDSSTSANRSRKLSTRFARCSAARFISVPK